MNDERDWAVDVGRVLALAILGGFALVLLAGCIYAVVWILAKTAGLTA